MMTVMMMMVENVYIKPTNLGALYTLNLLITVETVKTFKSQEHNDKF